MRRWVLGIALAGLALVVVALHRAWSAAPGWVDTTYGLLVAAAWLAALWGGGATTLPYVLRGAEPDDRLARFALAVVLGTALATLVLAVQGLLLGGLGGSGALVLAVGLPLALVRARARRRSPCSFRTGRWAALGLLLFLLPYAWRMLAPAGDWDSACCHLPLATRLLEAGPWFDTPDLQLLYRPGNAHLLYAGLLSLDAESAIVPLNACFVLLGIALVYAIGASVWGRRAGFWGAAVALTSSILLELGLDARVEPFLVAVFLAGVWGLVQGRRGDGAACPAFLWTVGTAGYAAGVKYSGLPVACLLVVAAVVLARLVRPSGGRRRPALIAAGVLLLLAPSGIWYLRNAVVWGDAVYPFDGGTKIHRQGRLEPLGDPLEDAPSWTRDADALAALRHEVAQHGSGRRAVDERRQLLHWGLAVRHPEIASPRKRHGMSPLLLLLPLVLLLRPRGVSVLVVGLCLAGMLWLGATRPLLRYQAPFLALAAVGVGALFARVRGRRARIVVGLLVALAAAVPWLASWKAARSLGAWAYLTGQVSGAEHLARTGHNGAPALARAALFFERGLASGLVAPGDRVWLVGEGKTHVLPLDAHASPGIDGRDLLVELRHHGWDVQRLHVALWREGYRWFLVNEGYLGWALLHHAVDPAHLVAVRRSVARFTDACCGPPVHDELDLGIWPLRPPP